MSVTEAFRTDDVAAAAAAFGALPDLNAAVCRTADGQSVSPLWVAAQFNAEAIAAWLVQRGANPLTDHGSACARDLAVSQGHTRALVGMIKGGFEPDQMTVFGFWKTRVEPELPLSALQRLAHRLAADAEVAGCDDDVERVTQVIGRSPGFREAFEADFSALDALGRTDRLATQAGLAPNSALRADLEAGLSAEATLLATMMTYGRAFSVTNTDVLVRVVREEFYGFRNERRWLTSALQRAAARLAGQVSARIGGYADDRHVVEIATFVISTLPVRAIAQGVLTAPAAITSDGARFEATCCATLRTAGYLVRSVGGVGDQGADLIASKEGRTFAIQCKDLQGSAGNSAVQEAIAARNFYLTDYAVVCARSGFTKSARALAATSDVVLVSEALLSDIDRFGRAFD